MQRGHDALDWIVEEHGTHPHRHGELKVVRGAEEWLVLAHGLALVVEDRPTAAHPAWIALRSALDQWSRLGLGLFLDLAPETV